VKNSDAKKSNEAAVGMLGDERKTLAEVVDVSDDSPVNVNGALHALMTPNPSTVYNSAVRLLAALGVAAMTFYVCKAMYNYIFESSFNFIPIHDEV